VTAVKPNIYFRIGDQVRLSALGRSSFAKSPDRRGQIVRIAETKTRYRVQWDGHVGSEYIHWTYLELDDEASARADGSEGQASSY
jgi:hypothetical protein